MKWLLLFAWLLCATALAADSQLEIEIRQLQAEIAHIQQNEQSVFQQFQMIDGLRRLELQAENPTVIENSPIYSSDNPPPNYDDLVRQKRERKDRIDRYTAELNNLYARYRLLEEQRVGLIERLNALLQQRSAQ
jgi:hypothetical protein